MDYPKEVLTRLYQTMLRIRYCEESLVPPILKGEIRCPVHLCTGQEAVAAGIGAVLEKKDYIFGNHRSHGHYLAKGGGMPELIAEIYGKETGCSKGRGGSMHLIDPQVGMLGSAPIVAGTIPLALGAALASSIRRDNRVTVSFFGDGATGEGVLYESLNFAALKKLPLIFACENNFYSTHLPIEEIRVNNRICGIGKPFGVKSFTVDGNDVLEVYEYAQKAVAHCRKGEGPVFLEFLTYRMRGHVGPDDNVQGSHTDIRPKHEIEEWRKKDPIKRIEQYLLRNEILVKKELLVFHEQIRQEVDAAHVFASNSPYPRKEDIDSYVFLK
ncbi:MAG: thiamine pyrophosphate-dependent dehydrogenase E1 component subunit alpha [Candidatus Scalindua sp.]|jgi:acetoin:2,6-dichlorophenolindophenol oxidoreductase subunit alpha|nr:thiamine pyrophosphate-dependent dehydrogenase E1 component subunit alpha [Candidatus Scalindua sp.]